METRFYLDDINLIRSNINESFLNGNLLLFKNDKEIDFNLTTDDNQISLSFFDTYKDNDIYKVVHEDKTYVVEKRLIVQSDWFDEEYCPAINLLGSFYHKNETIFRTWAPYSEACFVVINDEPYRMTYTTKGVYEASIKGDLEASKYHYELIRNNERISYKDIFSYSNNKDNKESYVIDTKKLKFKKIKVKEVDDPIIYELSVRDFSSDNSAPFDNRSKFVSFLEEGLKIDETEIGIDYLANLGVSHIQLMPINNYDYDGFDYGWGYNPLNLNILHRDYVKGEDAYSSINEFRSLVDKLHEKGLHVNVDVVYNHLYKIIYSDFHLMLPYYFFRYKSDISPANGTFCGNELRSEAKFLREYFRLLVERFIKIYDIDGLRFDLAGIIDIDTINYLIDYAHSIKKDFMMYGEGWNMGEVLNEEKRTSIENINKTTFGFFNGVYRDNLKGSFNEKNTKGYLLGNKENEEMIKDGLTGSFKANLNDKQSINYIECHDNYTFFDKVSFFGLDENSTKAICKSGLAILLMSKGIPFIHAGQEFLRSKNGNDNSYNLPDEINKIDWQLMVKNKDVVDYFKELIKFRKNHQELLKESGSFSYYYDLLIYSVADIDVFINPTEYPYIYDNWITYKDILLTSGKYLHNLTTFDIPAYSLIIAVKS